MIYIDIHTHQTNQLKEVIFIKNYFPSEIPMPNSFFSIGIHPWFLDENTVENDLISIENQLQHHFCLAIGECGLDKICKTEFEIQQKVFKQQLLLAQKYQKPVIIHCVKAHQELIEIIKNEKINIPLILHGFSKKTSIHQQLLQIPNIYFSFGKSVLSATTSQQNILETPLEKMFLETDDSQEFIETIYEKVAILKNISVVSLQNQLFLNFQKIFKIVLA